MGRVIPNKHAKFCDPSLSRSRKIPPDAVGVGICDIIFRDNFRPEVDSDVMCGIAVDWVGVDVHVKFGDSMSNGSRYIGRAVCVFSAFDALLTSCERCFHPHQSTSCYTVR